MLVIKRDGRKESVKFDKITARIEKLSYGLNTEFVKTIEIAKKVIDGLYDGVSTQELDELASETAAATLTTKHPDFLRHLPQGSQYQIYTKLQVNLFQVQ